MSNVSMEEVFEELWEQMEELSRSCVKADGKLARGIARYLVDHINLSRSYRIRAHMALTSLLCAKDALRDAEKDYAEVQCKISTGLHTQLQEELHAELKVIREAYDHEATEERAVTSETESAEDTTASTPTETTQLGPGSQEDPIDLTLDDDSNPTNSTGYESMADSGYAEATGTPSTQFSLPRSMVTSAAHPLTKAFLTPLIALLFIHPPRMRLISILIWLSITTWTCIMKGFQQHSFQR
jgi:hypothetical protein